MTDLNSLCYQAIAFKDIDSLNYLVQVCDQLHNGKEEVDGFKQEELPSDERYEEMKRILKQNTRTVLLGIQTEDVSVINRKYIREKRKIESNNVNTLSVNRGTKPISQNLLIVDGIQIEETVSEIENAILMKKYDGCSIACVFRKVGIAFKLDYARTRGTDKGCSRVVSDVTLKMQLLTEPFEKYFTELFNGRVLKIQAKNFEYVGNTNKPITVDLDTSNIKDITIRGELVLKNKLEDRPNASAVAGPLNGKFQTFKDRAELFKYIPFEIISITLLDSSIIVPIQKDSLKILSFPDADFITVPKLDQSFNFSGLLNTWQHTSQEPLDGIVYCSEFFTYPTIQEESSKRVGYGKYKFKKNDSMITRVTGFEYGIGSTGKVTCVCLVDRIIANGKNYERLKLPFRKIEEAMKKGVFGINCVIEVTLAKDIALTLSNTFPELSKDVIPYEFPSTCFFCGSELKMNSTKADTTISCKNPNCKGVLMKRLEKYLSLLGVKGISETTIFNYFKDREFSFRDFYRDVINVPSKSLVRRTGKTVPGDIAPKFNYNELFERATNEQLLVAFQICSPSGLKKKMEQYELEFNHRDIAALKRIDDALIKEVL